MPADIIKIFAASGIASGRKYLKSGIISASVKLVWVQAREE